LVQLHFCSPNRAGKPAHRRARKTRAMCDFQMQHFLARHSKLQGDLISSSEEAARVRQFKKTKICKFEVIGMCAKGHLCPFAHTRNELLDLPDLSRTKICKTLINSGRCDEPNCTYAHNREQLRQIGTSRKTKLCRFAQHGFCSLGDKCNFAHSLDELHLSDSAAPGLVAHSLVDRRRPKYAASAARSAHGSRSFIGYGIDGCSSYNPCLGPIDFGVTAMTPCPSMFKQDAFQWQAQMASGGDLVIKQALFAEEEMCSTGGPLRIVRSAEGRLDLLDACEDERPECTPERASLCSLLSPRDQQTLAKISEVSVVDSISASGIVVDQTDDVWQGKNATCDLDSCARSISAVSTAEGSLVMLDSPEQPEEPSGSWF